MKRNWKKLSPEEFKNKLIHLLENSDENVVTIVYKDLSKIHFEDENYTTNGRDFRQDCNNIQYDIHQLENGFIYCLYSVGGDVEIPLSFIVYFDDKDKLRGYIPKKGNIYNKELKCVYGSEYEHEDEDEDVLYMPTNEDIANEHERFQNLCKLTLNMEEFNKDILERFN